MQMKRIECANLHIFQNNLTVLLDQNVSPPHLLSYTAFSFNNINKSIIYRYLNTKWIYLVPMIYEPGTPNPSVDGPERLAK
jgi:hypothetical protein